MKIIITESQLKKLNEDITASRMIVYHRTGKKTGFNPSKNIADIGYNIGKGNAYGYGVYTTYDLESQLNDNMKMSYGDIIIESQILDISKFIIFNYDIAKKIYKSRYQFRDQLEQILGKKEWLNYKNNDTIKDIHNILDEGNIKYTSKLAQDFYNSFRDSIVKKLNGMIFTGGNDGNVLVVYNRRNIEPFRYSEDDGQTWTNVRNVKTYQRIKDSDDYKNNTEIQHILNKIENEGLDGDFIIKIPVKYQDYILNHLSKKGDKLNYDERDFINVVGLYRKFGDINTYGILNNSKDKEQTAIEIIEMKGDDLNSFEIMRILNYFTIPDKEGLMNIDVLIRKIIEIKGEKLENDIIKYLLQYSVNKDDIVTKIFETKGYKLNYYNIEELLKYSVNKDDIVTKIIDTKGEKLKYIDIEKLLYYSEKKDDIITKIINAKGEKLNDDDINYLLKYSDNKDDNATKIINIKGEKISGGEIYSLFFYSKDKEVIKKLLLQNGVNYERINDVIQMYNDNDTPYHLRIRLIPDNYQSMLQEIRKIKEIMK